MTVEEAIERKNILVGIRIDSRSRELLNWALLKVAEPGDHVVAVHVCKDSDSNSKEQLLLDDYLQVYEGLCNVKKVDLTGRVLKGSSIKKVLVSEARNRDAVAVIVGISKENPLRTWASVAKYCEKQLPLTTDVLAIHNGKIVFRRSLPGLKGDPRPSFFPVQNHALVDKQYEFGGSETSEVARHSHEFFKRFENGSKDGSRDSKGDQYYFNNEKLYSNSFSFIAEEQRPGWPLLWKAHPVSPSAEEARKMSVVKWVMSLPNRSPPETPRSRASTFTPIKTRISLTRSFSSCSPSETPQSKGGFSSIETETPTTAKSNNSMDKSEMSLSTYIERLANLDKLFKTNSSGFKWFSYEVIKTSTSQFSSDKLIGKGGCNRVYKGLVPNGKPVAVKVLNYCKEARDDFAKEVDIMTSLKHKNITPLLGICVEDNELISVYDFLPKGNLEDNLHGDDKGKYLLSWEVRFKIATGIAEALNYLHNECSPPVIHRDVKSSNILLSNEFEPQLSDFGLAIWGASVSSSFLTDNDVVGTFGYLAPEYFMYGRVSDKIDVYSYGVVLLELLSGKKPISSESAKGQESLVMWAKPKLEIGDLRSILDPNIDGKVNEVQIQRTALAALLCLTRSARLRPKMRQILEILQGKRDVDQWMNNHKLDAENQENTDDEVYPHSSAESHLGLAFLDVDDTSTSFSSVEQSSRTSVEEYLKRRWSRSSSLD